MLNNIYIVILNYNSSEDTITLYKLFDGLPYHRLVVDNCSNKSEQDKLKKVISDEDLVFNKANSGYAGGNNLGIDIAVQRGADFIWLLNPDIRVKDDILPQLLQHFTYDDKLFCIGPRICDRANPQVIYSDGGLVNKKKFSAYHFNHNKHIKDISDTSLNYNIDYVNGSAMLFRTSLLGEVGKMREDFFLYFEETEWNLRAKRLGYNIATDSSVSVFHSSSNKGEMYHYYLFRNRLWLAKICGSFFYPFMRLVMKFIKELVKGVFDKKYTKSIYLAKFRGIRDGALKTVGDDSGSPHEKANK